MALFEIKNDSFRDLKTNLVKLKKTIEKIEIKIEEDGMDGYYSINSDILGYAHRVYTSMRVLGYIKNFKGENNE
jgi:hypothetical protein